ncbi:MAG: DUF1269 domain-containing protein [Solirubrobacteraceae bacterium]
MAAVLAIGYPDLATAARAAEEARRLRVDLDLKPDAVAVIARGAEGEYRATTSHHPVEQGGGWGMGWDLLFGLVFFVPVCGVAVGLNLGRVLGEIEKSVNRAFQQQVRDMVTPGSSALFLFIGNADPERAVALLSKFGGLAVEVSLSDEQEARLQGAIHGSRLAAGLAAEGRGAHAGTPG